MWSRTATSISPFRLFPRREHTNIGFALNRSLIPILLVAFLFAGIVSTDIIVHWPRVINYYPEEITLATTQSITVNGSELTYVGWDTNDDRFALDLAEDGEFFRFFPTEEYPPWHAVYLARGEVRYFVSSVSPYRIILVREDVLKSRLGDASQP